MVRTRVRVKSSVGSQHEMVLVIIFLCCRRWGLTTTYDVVVNTSLCSFNMVDKVHKSKKSKKQAQAVVPTLSSFLLGQTEQTDAALDNIFSTSVRPPAPVL